MAAIATAFFFIPGLQALVVRSQEAVSYYDHAIYVPFAAAWMAWNERKRTESRVSFKPFPKWALIAALVFILLLQLLGSAQQITVIQGAALVLWFWWVVLWFGGRETFYHYRFPLFYLLLLVPIPGFFVAQMTLGLRELGTILAATIIDYTTLAMGVSFSHIGNQIHFGNHSVTIVDACSGMNTLFTVLTIGFVLIYLEESKVRSWLMTAALVPVAIAANLVRILTICVFVAMGYGEFAFGKTGHDIIGVFTVAVAIALLAFAVKVPARWAPKRKASKPQLKSFQWPDFSRIFSGSALSVYTVTIAIAALILLAGMQQPTRTVMQAVRDPLPKLDLQSWKPTELPMDQAVYDIVGTRDAKMFKFSPAAKAGASEVHSKPVYFYWIHSENSRKIGHPPELCYRSESYELLERSETTIRLKNREFPAMRMIVDRDGYRLLVIYWYRINGVETANYLGHQIQWALNQIKRLAFQEVSTEGSMIRLSTEIESSKYPPEKAIQYAEARLLEWIEQEDQLNR
ncbi:MAG: exosortase [Bdellovibrionales bacterium]|nr:exosortase [Bdellovibrionales bacterium]